MKQLTLKLSVGVIIAATACTAHLVLVKERNKVLAERASALAERAIDTLCSVMYRTQRVETAGADAYAQTANTVLKQLKDINPEMDSLPGRFVYATVAGASRPSFQLVFVPDPDRENDSGVIMLALARESKSRVILNTYDESTALETCGNALARFEKRLAHIPG